MGHKRQLLAVIILLFMTTTSAGSAAAALLGVQPGFPQISFDISSAPPPYATSFDPATGILTVSASPVSYRWSSQLRPVSMVAPKSLTIQVHLDSNGKLIPGASGDGVIITGNVTAAGQSYSGTLLTGTVTAFGFYAGGTTSSFDFRFTTTGGALQGNYAGQDIGITLASENSTFNGSFGAGFQGNAKGTVGAIPGPYLVLTQSCTDATGLQPIQFSATLTNSGTESLNNITCTASPDAVLAGVPTTLAAGAESTITGSYTPTGSPSTDTISCSATGSGSQVTVSKSSSATCQVLAAPAFSVAETCSDASAPGQSIPISALITNTGNEPLTGFSCTDGKGALLTGVPGTLPPGASATVTGSYLPTGSGSTDTITCSAKGTLDNSTVSATSSATCGIRTAPAFAVTESCANAPAPGLPINLAAVLTNTGNETLTGLSCTDSKGAILAGVPATLAPGATASLAGSYLPAGSGSTDTITCSATGAINGGTLSANASSTCNIATAPAFTVGESCSNASAPGQQINLTAVITNTGNEPLAGFTCTDSKGATIASLPASLAPGASATVTGSYLPTTSGSTDTLTCSASGTINSGVVSASSSSTCSIVTNPAFAIAESCSNAPAPGQPITISAALTNTGNEALIGFSCSDSKGAVLSGVPTTLAPGATASLSGSYLPSASGSTDTITCSATGSLNSKAVSANASSTCNIVTTTAISVAQSCGNAPAPGLPISLSAVITNSGNEPLTGISCSDSKGGSLSGVPLTLAPGASATVSGSYTTTASPSTDTITCLATGAVNGSAVTGKSSSTCSILNPAIGIRKLTNGIDAPTGTGPSVPAGSQVSWTYIVANTGDVPLTNVTVTDNKVPGVSCPQSTLAVGASMTCTATGTAIAGQYENTGTATGSAGGVTVSASYLGHYFGVARTGCTYTQGFWKTHPNQWPVASLKLGSRSYSKNELLAILQTPVAGNGLISLAHQLITAKLNSLSGASYTPAVQTAVNAADSLIGSLVVPPVGSGHLAPPATCTLEGILDSYNNGEAVNGPGHCQEAPTAGCSKDKEGSREDRDGEWERLGLAGEHGTSLFDDFYRNAKGAQSPETGSDWDRDRGETGNLEKDFRL